MAAPSVPSKSVWPGFVYDDAHAAIRFLGFEQRLLVPGVEEGDVAHAELIWPEGGGVRPGSADRLDSIVSQRPSGFAATYVVTDGPDALSERAMTAGAELVHGLRDEEYGSRGFSVRDPEGNIWSLGTYRGAVRE